MSVHYIELAPNQWTQLGEGEIVYKGKETNKGNSEAVNFDKVIKAGQGENLFIIELKDLTPGTYEWLRVSVTYQKYTIDIVEEHGENGMAELNLSYFVGFNTYISDHAVNDSSISIDDDKSQGFWMAELNLFDGDYTWVGQGQSEGTTVVNPNPDSPVPSGSCVVTGKFSEPLIITGNETEGITVNLAFSTNNSFEWKEIVKDGKWNPDIGENVVDMGSRGLHPTWK